MTFDNVDFTSLTFVDNGQTKVTRQGREFADTVRLTPEFTVWQNPQTGETIIFEDVIMFGICHVNMYSSLKGRDETKFRKNVGIIKACERGPIPLENNTVEELENFLDEMGFQMV